MRTVSTVCLVKLVYSYLKEKKQRTKIDTSFSSWNDLLLVVPQGSILGPLLFNIFLCDLFLLTKDIDIASYTDDNTPYIVGGYRSGYIGFTKCCCGSI